jgi:hypothetical protein
MLEGNVTSASEEQPENAEASMLVMLEGSVTSRSTVQLENTVPIPVTPAGIVRELVGSGHVLIMILVPELKNVKLLGIHMGYKITLDVPIPNVAPAA